MVVASISRKAGGIFHSLRSLSRQLSDECRVQVVALRDEFSNVDGDAWRPLSLELFDCIGPPRWGYSPGLRDRIGRDSASVVHACGLWMYPSYAAADACRRKKLPLIISPRGMLDRWALANSAWKKRLAGWLYEKRNLRSAACIHALCESEYESIRSYGLTNPVAIIPNGIDLPGPKRDFQTPWHAQIPYDNKVLLFLGRIHPKKGLVNLIKAWSWIKPVDWSLVIAGWSQADHEGELKKLAYEYGVEKEVVFLGPVFDGEKIACLQNADAFILPSFSEGLPMSVLEAWAYKLPVIMTGECNVPVGFEAKAAVEIRPEVESIAEGLKAFFGHSHVQQKEMGKCGFELVKSNFAWPQIADQMIKVYEWVLRKGEKPNFVRLD